jgi:hypothetical protein
MSMQCFLIGVFPHPSKNITENHDSEAIDAIIHHFFANTN